MPSTVMFAPPTILNTLVISCCQLPQLFVPRGTLATKNKKNNACLKQASYIPSVIAGLTRNPLNYIRISLRGLRVKPAMTEGI